MPEKTQIKEEVNDLNSSEVFVQKIRV
jgi:hypothetical protein